MFDNLERLASLFPPAPARPEDAPLPLKGVRVLDFGHFIAGPYAAMMLADFGADVIKVEAPAGGDIFRHFAPTDDRAPGRGGAFFSANRNKRSISVDLKHPDGLAVVHDLVEHSDVLIENFSTGVLPKLGLGYEACRARNPRLVYCSIAAYDRNGPFADRPGYDPVIQAESGLIDMTGFPDREGVRPAASIVDMGTALFASNTILAALIARAQSGLGQYCEVALFDCAVAMTGYMATKQLFSGADPRRSGNRNPDSAPSSVFRCRDSSFYLSTGNNTIFGRMCEAMGMPELTQDPRFATPVSRIRHADAITEIVQERLLQEGWAYWSERFRAKGVPVGEVRTLGQALQSPEAAHRGLTTVVPDPEVGWIPNVSSPARLSATPVAAPRPAPRLGEHNRDILREVLGYDDDRFEQLQDRGAFGASGRQANSEPTS